MSQNAKTDSTQADFYINTLAPHNPAVVQCCHRLHTLVCTLTSRNCFILLLVVVGFLSFVSFSMVVHTTKPCCCCWC